MSTIEITSQIGTSAVRKLREKKLSKGLPFMINLKELSSDQCYLEYPNGSIKLITILNPSRDIHVLQELTPIEAARLRERLHFTSVK